MIGPSGNTQILVATKPVDFRKQADTLAALVQEALAGDPFSGAVDSQAALILPGDILVG